MVWDSLLEKCIGERILLSHFREEKSVIVIWISLGLIGILRYSTIFFHWYATVEVTKSPSNEKLLLSLAVKVVKVVKGELEAWNMGHEWFDFCIFDALGGSKSKFQAGAFYRVNFLFLLVEHSWIRRVKSFLINLEKNLSWMLLWGTFAFVALSCWEENYNFFERSTFSFLCILPLQKWWKKDQSSLFFFLSCLE